MPEILGVYDLGTATIKHKGHHVVVGAISIRTSENESAPVDYIGYCRLNYKDSIIKNLKRIVWAKPEPVEKIVKPERKPQDNVIPAEAEIQEEAHG